MKAIKIKNIISAALALIMMAGMFAALPASAEEPTYDLLKDLSPGIMKFTESTESGYDFVATTETYNLCAYYIDLAYLLKDFDIDKFLEEYETGYVEIRNTNYNARVRYSTDGGEIFSSEYPYKEVYGEDRYGDDMIREYFNKGLCKFSRDDKTAYEDLLTFGNMAIFVIAYNRPVVLNLMVTTESSIVFVKTIKITCGYPLDAIKSVDIYDFDFTEKHNATLDTAAWSNVGNVISIKYLDENKKNERSTLVAGDKGYIEFTIAIIQNSYVAEKNNGATWYGRTNAHWDTTVQSHLKGSSYSGVETDSSAFVTFDDREYLIKLYHSYEIAEDAGKVIKQGTIKLTAPTDGAKPDATVSLSNIKSVVINRRSYPQFAAGNATWLKINSRGKLEAVKSFSAGTTYLALVKLKPYGNFYFDETSVKNLKVPGASKFTISYMRVGIDDYVKEDGYYLMASFKAAKAQTEITTPVTTEPRVPMSLEPVGAQNVVTHDPAEDVSFEVMAVNATGEVRYKWQACDQNGNVTDTTELSNGAALLIGGMIKSDNGKTFYYKCTATCGDETESAVFSVRLEMQYFDLTIKYNKSSITAEQGSSASIIAQTNIDSALVSDLVVEWYRADSADGKNEKKIAGANIPTFTVPTSTTGTAYYRCDISCKQLGEFSRTVYPSSKYVKVTVNAKPAVTTKPAETTKTPVETTKTPVETTKTPVETTKTPVETTKTPVETTKTPVETTKTPVETTKTPVETTKTPAETTAKPAETTAKPAETTKTPVETTKTPAETTAKPAETTAKPAETTKTPVETTKTPAETTAKSAETTAKPAETTKTPAETTKAPVETTEVPVEITTAEPEDITTPDDDATKSPETEAQVGGDETTSPASGDNNGSGSAIVWAIVGAAVILAAGVTTAVVLVAKKKRK